MKKRIKKILCLLFVCIFSGATLFACVASGSTKNSSGVIVNHSGSSTSGGGGTQQSEGDIYKTLDEMENPDYDFSSLYSGVYLICKPNENTKFYDDYSNTQMSFVDLVERQYKTLAEYLVYALNCVYGDTHATTNTLSTFSSAIIQDYSVLGIANKRTNKCTSHTGNIISIDCDECLAKVAGLRDDFTNNPFNFSNAMAGGYTYDTSAYSFTLNINTNFSKWNAGTTLNAEKIKEDLVKLMVTGDFNSNIEYSKAIKEIDHLGFTKSIMVGDKNTTAEIDLIKKYILQVVIGDNLVNQDNKIKGKIGGANTKINLGDGDGDIFSSDTSKHYYKAYNDVVNYLVDKAMCLGLDGSFSEEGVFENDTKTLFPQMAKILIEYYSAVDFKYNETGVEKETSLDEDSDEQEIDETTKDEEKFVLKNVMKEDREIISIIALPGLNEDVLEDVTEYVTNKYGEDIANGWENLNSIKIEQFALCVNNKKDAKLSKFIVRPKFYIKAQDVVILDSYVKNEEFRENVQVEDNEKFQKSEDEILVQYHEGIRYSEIYKYNAVAGYDLQDAIQEYIDDKDEVQSIRVKKYDGIQLVDENGKYNQTYYNGSVQRVWGGIFEIQGRYNVDNIDEYQVGTNAVFNGGGNFLQINFEYYDEAGKIIDTQPINFFNFNSYY